MKFRHIVVGTDGSAGSLAAVEWSATLASRTGANVTVVNALSPWFELGFSVPPLSSDALTAAVDDDLAGQWSAPLRKAEVIFDTQLVEDNPASALLASVRATNADLLVVGRHGRASWAPHVLGGVTHKVLHASPCAVAVVPTGWQGSATEPTEDVVVGFDGSARSLRALDWTIGHTQAFGTRIRVATAVFTQIYAEAAWLPTIDDKEATERATKALAGIVDQRRSGTAADIKLLVRFGHPGEVLVDESRHAQLLVVGSRGRGTAATMVLGSVAQHAATHAICPVAIVP